MMPSLRRDVCVAATRCYDRMLRGQSLLVHSAVVNIQRRFRERRTLAARYHCNSLKFLRLLAGTSHLKDFALVAMRAIE